MPQMIEHIDAIARKLQQDVLYIEFFPVDYLDIESDTNYDYRADAKRQEVIDWLDSNKIQWKKCGQFAEQGGVFCLGYIGDIFVEVPHDLENTQFQLVRECLENPDGTMKDENVRFYLVPLAEALENAHHDEEGYWDNL